MCGRIGHPELTWAQFHAWISGNLDWDDIIQDAGTPEIAQSWNVKPTQPVAMIFLNQSHVQTALARWWFVPHWHKGDLRDWKATTFNARIERAAELPTFRTAWSHQRCVVLASGYYEWTGDKGAKQPWWITPQSNAPAVCFAGLHAQHQSGARSCTILTRPALSQISHIHARTPVMLSSEEITPWLSGETQNPAAQSLGQSYEGRMQFHEVEKFGRDDDGPELIEPIRTLL